MPGCGPEAAPRRQRRSCAASHDQVTSSARRMRVSAPPRAAAAPAPPQASRRPNSTSANNQPRCAPDQQYFAGPRPLSPRHRYLAAKCQPRRRRQTRRAGRRPLSGRRGRGPRGSGRGARSGCATARRRCGSRACCLLLCLKRGYVNRGFVLIRVGQGRVRGRKCARAGGGGGGGRRPGGGTEVATVAKRRKRPQHTSMTRASRQEPGRLRAPCASGGVQTGLGSRGRLARPTSAT
jgi:hypothetical protein